MPALSLISKILVSSSEFILDNHKDKSGTLELKDGQIVEAKVLKILLNNSAKLFINGKTFVAKTHVQLKENETIKLRVASDGDSQVLRLVKKSSDPFLPEGLKEMRALGRSGLYSKLTKVISDYLPASKQQMPTISGNIELTTDLKENVQSSEMPRTKLNNPAINKTNPFLKIKPEDLSDLKLFLDNKSISWENKLSALISKAEIKTAVLPQKMMEKLAEKLVEKLILNFAGGTEQKTNKQGLDQLVNSYAKTEEMLPVKDRLLINNFVQKNSLPLEYKLLTLLSSGQNTLFAEDSAPVQKFLIKNLEQASFKIPDDILSEITGQKTGVALRPEIKLTLKNLENLLDILALKSDKIPDPESLKFIVKNSGLMWESKLSSVFEAVKAPLLPAETGDLINNDIKALAMKLTTVLEGEDKTSGNTLRSFVDGLEKMQLLNSHSSYESGRYLLPIPFFSNETLKFGQLLIDLDRREKQEENNKDRPIRVAFILEMSQLGHFKADFAIYKKSISGEFGVENKETRDLINQLLPGLKETLAQKGYIVTKIGCSVISARELAGTSLSDMLIDNSDGVLNIVV